MEYFTPKEIKSTPKVWKYINFNTFMAMLSIIGISMLFENLVYEPLIPLYYSFAVITGMICFFPSKDNPKRCIYQSLLIAVKKRQDDMLYRPVKNVSRKRDKDV